MIKYNRETGQWEYPPTGVDFSKESYSQPAAQSPDVLERQSMVPNVDFSKDTLAEQMPAAQNAGLSEAAGVAGKAANLNPYIAAAGIGLSALANIQAAKYKAAVDKYAVNQNALSKLAQIGQSLRA